MRCSRSLRCALAVVVGLCSGALALAPVSAGGVSDQEQTVQEVLAEIDRMHQRADQFAEDIVIALDQKAQLDAQILVAQDRIAAQQAQLVELEVQLGNVAVEKVMGGGSGALGPLFADPVAIEESLQRDHLSRVAVNAATATTDDYETLLAQFEQDQQALEEDQAQAVALAEQAEISRAKAEQAVIDLEEREKREEAKLGDLLRQEEARQEAAATAEYNRQVAEANANALASSNNGSGSGGSNSNGSSSNGGASVAASTGSGSSGSGSSGSGSSGSGSSDSGSSDNGGSSVPPVSSRASVAVNAASGQMGVPYKYATSNPGVSFDCSGLTAYAWGVAGVGLPHQSGQQYASTPHVPKEAAQPGDLIFYYSPISHVGIYVGGGSMIHAPQTGKTVSVGTVRWDKVVGVSRPG